MAADNRALAQWEIDALLDQVPATEPATGGGGGGASTREAAMSGRTDRPQRRGIRYYDFRRPDKFSREQWATLHSMHETFARIVGASFSSRLRTLVTVRLSSLDQGLYEEWQAQVPSPTTCYVLSLSPLSGNIVVEFNSDVASEVVDRLLGGTGLLIDRARDMSEVETALLRSFSNALRQTLEETWGAVVRISPELQDLGFDAGLIQVAAPTDVVLTAFFEVNIGNHLGAMSVCIPYTVIEPVAADLSTQIWFQSGRHGPPSAEERQLMEALLGRAALDMHVMLGDTDLPTSTVIDMQEGDTIVLNSRPGRPLDISIGEHARFRGFPGVMGNRMAVQITDVVEPDPLPAAPTSWEQTPAAARRRRDNARGRTSLGRADRGGAAAATDASDEATPGAPE
jgi:flagellar motor switch protein FliM